MGGLIYVAGPTPWHILPRALRKVGASDDDVFVEFGCGKGRVVHQAARRHDRVPRLRLPRETMDAVLRNLIESIDSRPRRVRLIYYWPTSGVAQVLATGRFRLLPDISFGCTAIFESCG
jgi:hypothetical protein